MGNPHYLNLDDLETDETNIKIKHKGVEHSMRVLEVDQFIEQQKRAIRQQKLAAEAESVGDKDMVEVMELIRDSIKEFFPTLPVGELATPKLFLIFGWLNDMTDKVNELGAPESGDGVSTEGKVETVQS